MSSQHSFAQALLNPDAPAPTGLSAWNGVDPARRFAVYRNNVFASLIDALVDTYPVVQELVGEAFFRAMAKVFVQSNPPRSRVMAYYGAGFADFVEDFSPARALPYLADVARLEMTRIRAYHAADTKPVNAEHVQAALHDPQGLLSLRLVLHPSVHVISSSYAIGSLWAAHQGVLMLSAVDPQQPESVLVFRHDLEVAMLQLTPTQGRFVEALQRGATLSEAAVHASVTDPGFDLPDMLALLMRWQLIIDMTHGATPDEATH